MPMAIVAGFGGALGAYRMSDSRRVSVYYPRRILLRGVRLENVQHRQRPVKVAVLFP